MTTSNISCLWGATTQERDVTAGSEKREKVTSQRDRAAQLVRADRQWDAWAAQPVHVSRRRIRGNGRGEGSDVTLLWQLPDGD